MKSIAILFILGFAALLSQVSWGKRLLCTYPEFFTAGFFRRGGPTRAQVLCCGFTMYGMDYSWKCLINNNVFFPKFIRPTIGPLQLYAFSFDSHERFFATSDEYMYPAEMPDIHVEVP